MAVQVDFGGVPAKGGVVRWLVEIAVTAVAQLLGGVTPVGGDCRSRSGAGRRRGGRHEGTRVQGRRILGRIDGNGLWRWWRTRTDRLTYYGRLWRW